MTDNFVNFSNHPHEMWSAEQRVAAEQYGRIIDISFPAVDPYADSEEITAEAEKYVEQILGYKPAAVMCQGEFTLCYAVISRLRQQGIRVLAACSERKVIENGDTRQSVFSFVRFREYSI